MMKKILKRFALCFLISGILYSPLQAAAPFAKHRGKTQICLPDGKPRTMRSQIQFRSDTIPEYEMSTSLSPDYPVSTITVKDVPADAIINQVALTWEGVVQNNNVETNSITSGAMALSTDGATYNSFLAMSSTIKFNHAGKSYARFVAKDLLTAFQGSVDYAVKFIDLRCEFPNLTMSGNWILEIDYETR